MHKGRSDLYMDEAEEMLTTKNQKGQAVIATLDCSEIRLLRTIKFCEAVVCQSEIKTENMSQKLYRVS